MKIYVYEREHVLNNCNYKEMQIQKNTIIKKCSSRILKMKKLKYQYKKALHFPSIQNLKRNVITSNKIFVEHGSIEKL